MSIKHTKRLHRPFQLRFGYYCRQQHHPSRLVVD